MQYCLLAAKSNDKPVLISGCESHRERSRASLWSSDADFHIIIAGDETVKLWTMQGNSIELLQTLESESDAVLSLACRDNTLYAGHQGGVIKVRPPHALHRDAE